MAEDGVEEDIEFSFISDDYVEKMAQRVEKLKTLSREAEEAKKSGYVSDADVEKARGNVRDLKNLLKEAEKTKEELDRVGESPKDISSDEQEEQFGGIYGGPAEGKVIGFKDAQKISGGVRGSAIRDKLSASPAPHDPETKEFLKMQSQVDVMQEAMDLLGADVAANKKSSQQNIREIKQMEQKVIGGITQGLGAIRDPFGFMKSKAFGMLTKVAIPIGAAVMIATVVFEMVKAQFGPGGLLDVRKMILDSTREYAFQSDLIDIDRGTIFFATTNTLNQSFAEMANGDRKVMGHNRDIHRNAGQ